MKKMMMKRAIVCLLFVFCIASVLPMEKAHAWSEPVTATVSNLQTAGLKPSLTNVNGGIKLSWTKASGTAKYRILYRVNGKGSWKKLTDTKNLTYTWKNAKAGTKYAFTLQRLNASGKVIGSYDKTGSSITYVPAPVLKTLTRSGKNAVLTWAKSAGAVKYRVYRKEGTGAWKKLTDTTALSYTDKTAKLGVKYTYTVRCITSNGKSYTSGYNTTGKSITLLLAAPKLVSATATTGVGVTVSWGGVSGVPQYRVYRKEGTGSWKKLKDTKALIYIDRNVQAGKKYIYTVRGVSADGKLYTSNYDTKGKTVTAPQITLATPTLLSAKPSGSSSVTVTWKTVNGAVKYRVFRKVDGGTWQKLGDTTSAVYVDYTAVPGVNYTYTVRCITADGKTYISGYNALGLSLMLQADKPTIAASDTYGTSVDLSWNSVTGAIQYEVLYRTADSGWTVMGRTPTTSCTASGLSYDVEYYFTVRCVNVLGMDISGYLTPGVCVLIPAPVVPDDPQPEEPVTEPTEPETEPTEAPSEPVDEPTEEPDDAPTTALSEPPTEPTTEVQTPSLAVIYTPKVISVEGLPQLTQIAQLNTINDLPVYRTSMQVTWKTVQDAWRYQIFLKELGSNTWTLKVQTPPQNASGDTMSATVFDLTPGTFYFVMVKALDSRGNVMSGFDPYGTPGFTLAQPEPDQNTMPALSLSSLDLSGWAADKLEALNQAIADYQTNWTQTLQKKAEWEAARQNWLDSGDESYEFVISREYNLMGDEYYYRFWDLSNSIGERTGKYSSPSKCLYFCYARDVDAEIAELNEVAQSRRDIIALCTSPEAQTGFDPSKLVYYVDESIELHEMFNAFREENGRKTTEWLQIPADIAYVQAAYNAVVSALVPSSELGSSWSSANHNSGEIGTNGPGQDHTQLAENSFRCFYNSLPHRNNVLNQGKVGKYEGIAIVGYSHHGREYTVCICYGASVNSKTDGFERAWASPGNLYCYYSSSCVPFDELPNVTKDLVKAALYRDTGRTLEVPIVDGNEETVSDPAQGSLAIDVEVNEELYTDTVVNEPMESIVIVDEAVNESSENYSSEPAAEDVVDPEVEVEPFSEAVEYDEVVPEG